MTDEEIFDLADPFLEWTEQGYAVIDKIGFARAIERKALEKAAQACQMECKDWYFDGDGYAAADLCAKRIRALIQDTSIKDEKP